MGFVPIGEKACSDHSMPFLLKADNLLQAGNLQKYLTKLLFAEICMLQLILQCEQDHLCTVFVAGILAGEAVGVVVHVVVWQKFSGEMDGFFNATVEKPTGKYQQEDSAAADQFAVQAVAEKPSALGYPERNKAVPAKVSEDMAKKECRYSHDSEFHRVHNIAEANRRPPKQPIGIGDAQQYTGQHKVSRLPSMQICLTAQSQLR